MKLPIPVVAFTRGDEKKALVSVNPSDLSRTIREHMTVVSGLRILRPRPHKVLVQIDGKSLKGVLVKSDLVVDLWGHVRRVTLGLPNDTVVILEMNATGKLIPRQAVWTIKKDQPATVG